MSTVEEIVRAGGFGTREYWRAVLGVEAKVKELPPHPAPEHTTKDPMPAGLVIPEVVEKFRRAADATGWVHRIGYARGHSQHAITGRPVRFGGRIALQMLHPDTRSRVVLTYHLERGEWEPATVQNPTGVRVIKEVTDVMAFVLDRGDVGHLLAWRLRMEQERKVKFANRKPAARKDTAGKAQREGMR